MKIRVRLREGKQITTTKRFEGCVSYDNMAILDIDEKTARKHPELFDILKRNEQDAVVWIDENDNPVQVCFTYNDKEYEVSV